MVDVMDAPPERLYRPDKAIIAWRDMCETQSRQPESVAAGPAVPAPAEPAADGRRRRRGCRVTSH